MTHSNDECLTPQLSLIDTVSLIIGIVVGVSIFKMPGMVFANVEYAWQGVAAWVAGGVLSLVGALCFAELASTYPRSGGPYVYLRRAFGPSVGFLFGWGQLVAITTGSIGALAYVFADYSTALLNIDGSHGVLLAVWAVVALTATNIAGVVAGKTLQNLLTFAKLIALVGIAVAGFMVESPTVQHVAEPTSGGSNFGVAMILVLYAYGGWGDAAFVTAEVRDRRRNIALALILGVAAITVVYLIVNLAMLRGLGFSGLAASGVPATDLLKRTIGDSAGKTMSAIVMVSALGAINGMIFTGARVYVALGADHALFARLSKWNSRLKTPIWSLVVQALIALAFILSVGTQAGQHAIDRALDLVRLGPVPWKEGSGFETLVAATAPVFWIFFALTGVSLIVLRHRDAGRHRPFRVPFYPFTPIIFCATSVYMIYASVIWAGPLTALGLVPLAMGGGVYAAERWSRRSRLR